MFKMINFQFEIVRSQKLCLTFTLILLSIWSSAQLISGKIIDEQNIPVPYATIYIAETKEGTTSNSDGNFQLLLPQGNYNLTIRSMGYKQLNQSVNLQTDSLFLPITLKTQAFEIKEVKIFPGKEDASYFIMRKAMAKAPYYRKKIKHYTADLYIKSNFEFTNIPKLYQNKIELEDGKKLKDYFKENVTYVIESQNKITYDYPNTYDQKVISKKTSLIGFDEPPVMGLITTSIYEERPFQSISPLSSMALKHYNFQYEGYITVDNFDVYKIKVTPKRKSDELLEGYIYIVDKLWCVYNMDLNSSFEFFDLRLKQQFQNLGSGNWLPVSYSINGKVSMLGLRGNFYYGASVKYDSIVDNYQETIAQEVVTEKVKTETQPVRKIGEKEQGLSKEVAIINKKEQLTNADVKKVLRLNRKILKEQYQDSTIVKADHSTYKIDDKKDSLITIEWDTIRAIPLTPAELQSYHFADSIIHIETADKDSLSTEDKQKRKKNNFSKFMFGASDLAKDSLIRFGYDGLLTTENFDYNTVDGYKYKQTVRFRYTLNDDAHIGANAKVGYAFNRKAVFWEVKPRLVNVLAKHNTISFSAGKMSYDFKGLDYGITPPVNAISSWFFGENYMKLYESQFLRLKASQRIKDFTFMANLNYDHFHPLENNVDYVLSDNKEFSSNVPKGYEKDNPVLLQQKSFTYDIGAVYRKRQRKPWLDESPFLFIDDYYTVSLAFKQGLPDVFNSVSDFSQIAFNFHQQANITPSSGIDWRLNAGYFFNADQMHFSQFKHFRTSEIPVEMKAFSNTLQNINDYEFSTNDSYLNISADYRTEYLLLRYFSFINKKTWSESFHINYLTTPALENYWEVGYSLNSLFFVGNIGVFTGFKGGDFESVSLKLSISAFD